MKFERFIATFIMMNIVLLLGVVFFAKNHLIMMKVSEMIYGENVSAEQFDLPPSKLNSFASDSPEDNADAMEKIYSIIPEEDLLKLADLSPYEKATGIIKMFSLMGDGKCLTDKTIPEKLELSKKKEGCSKDFTEIFILLASNSGIEARPVSIGTHYAAEIYNGKKWIYIDPYYAMSVSSETALLSFRELAERMLSDGWMRFNFFGGEEHCMSGKPLANHPYFGDKMQFAVIYAFNGNNVLQMSKLDNLYGKKPAFIKYIAPYKNGMPEMMYTELGENEHTIVKKYVKGLLALLAAIFIGTNIVLPLFFIVGLLSRKK